MTATDLVHEKIIEIIHEMKCQQLWKNQTPGWVTDFSNKEIISGEDFAGWLQFVFLPNLEQHSRMNEEKKMVAPQAVKFFGEDVRKGKLLQLLIELDSLS
jgi:uncharacterized protein YqcC (DUF446 family)